MSTAHDLPLPSSALAPAALPAPSRPQLRLAPPAPPDEPLAFDEAVRRLRPRLHRFAVRRLGDAHEAEELVQEALLRAYAHRDSLATEDELAAWTTVVTGRLAIDRLRVRGRATSVAEVPEGARTGRDTADVVVARDEARTALDALDAMPARQAAVLWAREVEGRSYAEIGTTFGMTEPAVRSVLLRARKALRREYAARGGTLPAGGLAVLAPWLSGLRWAGRLRRAATRGATPAVLGSVGLSVLGGLLVLGPSGTPSRPEALGLAPAVAVSAAEPRAQRGVVAASVVSPVALRTAAQGAATAVPAPRAARPLVDRLLPDGCTQVGTTGAGRRSCSPAMRQGLFLGRPLPANPTGLTNVGVEADDTPCAALPHSPLLSCSAPGGSS